MTEIQNKTLSREEARLLTDLIRERLTELWDTLLQAYEGGAHTALGYSSWAEYAEQELNISKSRGYQLLDSGRVVRAIETHSAIVERPNEAQARELAPLAKEDPEAAARAWEQVVGGASEADQRVTAKGIQAHISKPADKDRGDYDYGKALAAMATKGGREIVEIVRLQDPEYLVRTRDGNTARVARTILLKEGFKKCSCCSGHGVERKD